MYRAISREMRSGASERRRRNDSRCMQLLSLPIPSDVSLCPCPQGLLKDQNEVLVLVLVLGEKSL